MPDRVERILFIDDTGNDIATIDVDKKNAKPVWRKSQEIKLAIQVAEACILEIDHRAPAQLTASDLDKPKNRKTKKVRDNRWEVIAPLISEENAIRILFLHERAALIAERTTVKFAHGKGGSPVTYSRKSIYSFIRLWWQGGQVKNALLGKYECCGARGKERTQKEKKLGRPSKISINTEHSTGVVLTPYWLNIICLGALLFFNNQKIKDIQTAYRNTLRHFCPKGKIQNKDGEWEIVIRDYTKGEVFSPIQFKYHVLKKVDLHLQEFFRKKFGERRYNLRYRGLKGNSTREAPYPGAIYQIDATIADVYLVSRLNRTHIIGRPVITVIIDVFSRMIVGVCVRMEREGWNVISLALKNAVEAKVAFCEKYDIEIEESEWPVIGLCDSVIGDRGPMKGYNADNLVAGLGVTVSTLPPFRADWKGIVEQMFHLMNIRIIRDLPGALNPDKERGDRDVRLDAVLDINQFTAIVIKAILYHNNHHHMSAYPFDKDMIAAGVKPVPRELFIWGMENRSGSPRHKDAEAIRVHLLPGGEATVTARGIRFKGEFYTCQLAEEDNWRFRARNQGTWKVSIAYDPRIPRIIYLRQAGSMSIPCHLIDTESIAATSDLAEIEEYLEYKHIEDRRAEVTNMQGRVDLDASVDLIVSQAQEMSAEARSHTSVVSKASRLSNINENRQAEIDEMNEEYRRERLKELGISSPERTSISSPQDAGEEHIPRPRFSNVLSIQERKMKQHGEKK